MIRGIITESFTCPKLWTSFGDYFVDQAFPIASEKVKAIYTRLQSKSLRDTVMVLLFKLECLIRTYLWHFEVYMTVSAT